MSTQSAAGSADHPVPPSSGRAAGAPSAPVASKSPGSVPPALQGAAAWSWRFLAITGVIVVVGYVLVMLRVVVIPIAVALLLTVLLAPVVRFVQKRLHLGRTFATALSMLFLALVVLGLLVLAGSSIAHGFGDLKDQAVQGFEKLTDWLKTGPLGLNADDLSRYTEQISDTASKNSSVLVSGALGAAVTVGHVAAGTLIALFCTFFFLHDGRRIWAWLVGLLPLGQRDLVHQAGRRGLVTLAAYTRTQILVAAVDAVGIGIGAVALRLPLALPLSILVFVGSFIPVVGAVLTGAVAVAVALVAKGWVAALIMLGVVLVVQQIEGHVLQPFLMGHAVSLHPVAVLLSVAAASFIAGIVGALFAVPFVALVNTFVLYLKGHDKFPDLGDEDHLEIRGRTTDDTGGRLPPAIASAEADVPAYSVLDEPTA